ncbi:hypothetical protein [Pseudonocardia sp. WMMC193]|uniref:hypothetical protein n=1 Tax=Pseudonocardia sp. WMMC193 TaxID=2911965 RepID=UPI001F3D9AC6|nr:hypothetical protein [Pseudonocardia sp. WMMC193]MCF7550961.1 hypothetical protein [Pseudonocardia sp. WMMC193]
MDPAALTAFVTALGALVAAFGGLQLRRNKLDKAEREQQAAALVATREDLGRTNRLLGLAVRHIARQDIALGYAGVDEIPLHPELLAFIRGEDDERDPAQPSPRRPRQPLRGPERRPQERRPYQG